MKKNLKAENIIILALTSFLLISFFSALSNIPESKAFKLMTTKQPERTTELYFANYTSIPKKLKTNHLYKIDFITTNREYRRSVYTYKAIMTQNHVSTAIAAGKFSLDNNQSSKERILFKPTKPKTKVKIIIKLINKDQEIRFKART